MEKKKVEVGHVFFTWTIIAYFLLVNFVIALCEGRLTEESFTFSSVIGFLVIPLVCFLLDKLFSVIMRKKKEIVSPRWMDLLIVYAMGFGGAIPCLSYSMRVYWIAVPILMIFASVFVVIKAFIPTKHD